MQCAAVACSACTGVAARRASGPCAPLPVRAAGEGGGFPAALPLPLRGVVWLQWHKRVGKGCAEALVQERRLGTPCSRWKWRSKTRLCSGAVRRCGDRSTGILRPKAACVLVCFGLRATARVRCSRWWQCRPQTTATAAHSRCQPPHCCAFQHHTAAMCLCAALQ